MAMGETTPPKLPIIFMAPDSVPAYLPPTSMQAPQLPGIAKSFEKLAIPMESIAQRGSGRNVDKIRNPVAPVKPRQAINRRVLTTLPVHLATGPEMNPQKSEPSPPKKSGRTASRAPRLMLTPRALWRQVGSQVM